MTSDPRSWEADYTVGVPILKVSLLTALLTQPVVVAAPVTAPAAAPAATSQDAPRFSLRFVSPDPMYLVGRTRVQAAALDATGSPSSDVAWMTLSVDGRELPADTRAPFEWEVDVGGQLDRHRLQLTAVAKDGARTILSVISSANAFVEAVGVDLVLVPVVVREAGRPVTGLTARDFTVLEDGAPRQITSLTSEPMPASIAVALDNSQSMEKNLWSAQKAITDFMAGQPSWTSFALLTFNDQVYLDRDFSYDTRQVAGAVAASRVEGTRIALYDALRIGSMYLGRRPGARILLIFTDGEDTVYEGDEGRLRTAVDAAQAADVTVFAIAYAGAGSGKGAAALDTMTRQTGGEVAAARSAKDLKAAFARIGDSIGSRYLLGYEPPDPKRAGYRSIEVRVSRSGAEVLARRGYMMH